VPNEKEAVDFQVRDASLIAVFQFPLRRLLLTLFFALASAAGAKEVEFRLDRPDAQTVGLAAEFNGWKSQAMSKGPDGVWTVTLPLAPGTYGYKFLVNGSQWLFDPQNAERKQVDNIENSAVTVTDESGLGSVVRPTPALVAAAASTLAGAFAGPAGIIPVTPGEVGNFEVPLSLPQQRAAITGGNPPIATAKIALGVPPNFDPQKSWPLLLINATVDASSIELLGAYQREALAAGWVIMAADSPVKPKDDNTERRLAAIEAGLDFLNAHWPSAKSWPIACGGFSGGAKRSGYVAAALMKQQRKIIGVLMGGCNEDTATAGLKRFNPLVAFKWVPIFLSSGTTDQIATTSMIQYVEKSMKFSGFRNVRFETYEGAHDVYPQHTTEALRWFIASSSGGASPSPHFDFDKFFKKP